MADVIEDITYRDQSMPMPASLEARVFLPGSSARRGRLQSTSIAFYFRQHGAHADCQRRRRLFVFLLLWARNHDAVVS